MVRFFSDTQLNEMVRHFDVQGYLRVENALTTDQICRFDQAIDCHIKDYPEDWMALSDSFCEAIDVLPHTDAFDAVIESPLMIEILRAILGENLTFEEFAIMLRNPTANLNEIKGWHRDIVRDYERRKEIYAVSVMWCLTDVSPTDHCFCIVPESHNRLVDLHPRDVAVNAGVDLIGSAGTAVLFHARAKLQRKGCDLLVVNAVGEGPTAVTLPTATTPPTCGFTPSTNGHTCVSEPVRHAGCPAAGLASRRTAGPCAPGGVVHLAAAAEPGRQPAGSGGDDRGPGAKPLEPVVGQDGLAGLAHQPLQH
jgi:hypothetical protein